MPYFHQSVCISPQKDFSDLETGTLQPSVDNLLKAIEPSYSGIPAGAMRRLGKSVRMALGAALPLMEKYPAPQGIVIATANGGMEDCIKFLNQIIDYREGLLTPANFVQSTSNAAAAQIALVTKNHQYNITHVHRGFAFENALLDVMMLLKENQEAGYLLGCTDEISAYNYNIDRLDGWFRKEPLLNTDLFQRPAQGSIAGEGAFMVWMNNLAAGAVARLVAVKTIQCENKTLVTQTLKNFLSDHFPDGTNPDLLISGENGDERLNTYFNAVESAMDEFCTVARFKHLCGEYCTASSFACWLSMQIIQSGILPSTLIKKRGASKPIQNVLIYNNYRGKQHAFMLISAVDR